MRMASSSPIAILGAGAWGTALAITLARDGHRVFLCPRRPEQARALIDEGENKAYLPGVRFPRGLEVSDDWPASVASAHTIVFAVPSSYLRSRAELVAASFPPDAAIVSATKGIEADTLKTMTQVIADYAPKTARLAALSGPGFAAEIAAGKPAALVLASADYGTASELQRLFAIGPLRIYRSADLIGVELGGAVKNVIAIAAGICDGLGLGVSARAALVTRGLAEVFRLGAALGARQETLAGLAGMGDLVLTCTSALSRNYSFGVHLARNPDAARADMSLRRGSVAEGIANARSVHALAQQHRVEMPIVEAVRKCIYEDREPRTMVEELLRRELKPEFPASLLAREL